ncbi:MAG TPA: SDR family oxidoreductase [Smithellaceae bacterium]|nr:SDR family oxidoreductase [Smithellaceae bacterium]HRS88857.1 SDR family oxidoreductase [Smithellaceae bacterium]HRV26793.1 SDR family oxidoreductase [Smithellaceae bacterium]
MEKRLEGKVAIVTGAGQTPGDTIGNGRAISVLFARAGAKVMAVDHNLSSAQETQRMIIEEGGESFAFEADVTSARDCQKIAEACAERYGCIDILVNNVGTGGEALGPVKLKEEDWERIYNVNVKSVFLTCKHVIPYMEKQGGGAIVNISSIASVCASPMLAYKTSKAAVNSFTHAIAFMYAPKGIRANTIMPGFMNTPMAIEGISRLRGIDKKELIKERSSMVPLKGGMGTGWDTAYAALFLASDEAKFITGALLPVDGGQSARVG